MIRINLIPVKVTKKKARFMNQIYVAVFILILTFVGVGWRAYSMKNKIADVQSEIDANKRELQSYKKIQQEVKKFQEQKKLLEKKINVIKSLELGRSYHVEVVDQISQAIPGNVWVTLLTFNARGGGRSGSGSGNLSIQGGAYEKEAIGHFISNIQSRKDYFSSVSLAQITSSRKGQVGTETYNYKLDVSIKPLDVEKRGGK